MSSGEIVKLNIGGSIFQTSKSTLTKFDGFFKTMLETEIPIAKDDSGAIFVDRPAKHFESILNFMRDGDIDLQKPTGDVKEILKEAKVYELEELVKMCSMEIENQEVEEATENLEKVNIKEHKLESSKLSVKLNIGGAIFEASKSTLTKFDGFFKTMLESDVPMAKDTSGATFIDRSPKHFDRILTFMRDGHIILPVSSEAVDEILKEAQFYLLESLVESCALELQKRAGIKVLENEKEYFQVTAEPVKPTLVFYCSIINGIVSYPNDFKLKTFLREYDSLLDIYFYPFKYADLGTDYYPYLWSWNFHWNEQHYSGGLPYEKDECGTYISGANLSFETELKVSVGNFLNFVRSLH